MRWEQIDFDTGLFHVRRLKWGIPTFHPLREPERRALRKLKRESPPSSYLLVTERESPMTAASFRKLLTRVAEYSPISFPVHPHMLRHAFG